MKFNLSIYLVECLE